MRISDWSSDVCSSDLFGRGLCRSSLFRRGGLFFGLLGGGGFGLLRWCLLGGSLGLFFLGLFLHRVLLGGLRVMVMVVTAARAMDVTVVVGFDRGLDLFARHFALADLGLVEQEVDDLVLIERRAELRGGERVLLDIFDETLALFGAILLRRLHDQALHLLLRNLHAIDRKSTRLNSSH